MNKITMRKEILRELMEKMPGLHADVRRWVNTLLRTSQRKKTGYPFTKNEFAVWLWNEAHKVTLAYNNTSLKKTWHIWDAATHLAEILSEKGLLADDTDMTAFLPEYITEHELWRYKDALHMGQQYVDYCKSNHIPLTEYQFNRDVRPLMRMRAVGTRENMPELMYRIKYNDDYTKWIADAFWPYRNGAWTHDNIYDNVIFPLERVSHQYAGYVDTLWGKYNAIVKTGVPNCEQDMIDEVPYYLITHDIMGDEVEDADVLAISMKQADQAADDLLKGLRSEHCFDETREAFVREETKFVLSASFYEVIKNRYWKQIPPFSIIPTADSCAIPDYIVAALLDVRHDYACKRAAYYDYEAVADAFMTHIRQQNQ